MKNFFLLILFYYLTTFTGYSQSLNVVYEVELLPNEAVAPEFSDFKIKYHYTLVIENNKGISKLSRDSALLVSIPNTSQNIGVIYTFDEIYKDYNEDLWIKSSGEYKDGHGLVKNISQIIESNHFQWQITHDKEIIAGIACIKAVSPKGYTVWFAPSLPYPDGPKYGVFNLPGLVLSLETPIEKWIAKSTHIQNTRIQIPNLVFVQKEKEIKLSFSEMKSLLPKKAVLIDKNTPKGQWIKFEK